MKFRIDSLTLRVLAVLLVVELLIIYACWVAVANDLPVTPPKSRGANKGPGVPTPPEPPPQEDDPRDAPAQPR